MNSPAAVRPPEGSASSVVWHVLVEVSGKMTTVSYKLQLCIHGIKIEEKLYM